MRAGEIEPPLTLSRSSRLHSLAMLILLTALTLGSWWIIDAEVITRYPSLVVRLVGWFGTLFFGFGALTTMAELFVPTRLQINPDGFSYKSLWRRWHVRWEDIDQINVRTSFGTRNVVWRTNAWDRSTKMFDHDGVLPNGWTSSADDLCNDLIAAKIRYENDNLR